MMAFVFDNLPPIPDSMRKIMIEVCRHHDVTPADLASTSRRFTLVHARREYVYRCRSEIPQIASYPRIARSINQDHTSALHAMNVARANPEKMRPFRYLKDAVK